MQKMLYSRRVRWSSKQLQSSNPLVELQVDLFYRSVKDEKKNRTYCPELCLCLRASVRLQ